MTFVVCLFLVIQFEGLFPLVHQLDKIDVAFFFWGKLCRFEEERLEFVDKVFVVEEEAAQEDRAVSKNIMKECGSKHKGKRNSRLTQPWLN